jgi:hypothetical protein
VAPVKFVAYAPGAVLAGTICALAYLMSPPDSSAASAVHVGGDDLALAPAGNIAAAAAVVNASVNGSPLAAFLMPFMSSSLGRPSENVISKNPQN